jgi:hypothetical protein
VQAPTNPTCSSIADETELRKALCADEYWNSVWIVQEIGKARRLKVCFGVQIVDWEAFINWLIHRGKVSHDDEQGPMKLQRSIRDKPQGGHTLRRLLYTHQGAKCKEKRDKIYGLVGLAQDARGFPMDYDRPLIDIWDDVMNFMRRWKLLGNSEDDVVDFARLVRRLLSGSDIGHIQQVIQPAPLGTPRPIQNQSSETFCFQARILGNVVTIGPSLRELVRSFAALETWETSIQKTYASSLSAALRENEHLMNAALATDGLEPSDMGMMGYSHCSDVEGIGARGNDSNSWTFRATTSELLNRTVARAPDETRDGEGAPHPMAAVRAFQLVGVRRNHHYAPWKIGVTPASIQLGDVLLWVTALGKAVIARPRFQSGYAIEDDLYLRLLGTATMADDLRPGLAWADVRKERDEVLAEDIKIEIALDSRSLFVLLA